jgi:hypothetical protein
LCSTLPKFIEAGFRVPFFAGELKVVGIAAGNYDRPAIGVVVRFLLGSVIPFTLIAILPTNKQLLRPTLDKHCAQTGELLAHWGRLHAVRSALSGAALLLFLYLVIFMKSA